MPPRVGAAADEVVARAMAKLPDDRYATAGKFAAALHEAALGTATVTSPASVPTIPKPRKPPPSPGPPRARSSRRTLVLVAAAVVLIVVAGLMAKAVTGGPKGSSSPTPPAIRNKDRFVELDPASGRVRSSLHLPVTDRRFGERYTVMTGQGSVWLTLPAGTTWRIDPRTGERLGDLEGVCCAGAVSDDPNGAVWGLYDGGIARVNAATGEVVARIPQPDPATAMVIGDGALWILGGQDNRRVYKIDIGRNRVVAKIPYPVYATTFAVGDGLIWVNDVETDQILGIDVTSGMVAHRISVVGGASELLLADGSLWAINTSQPGTLIQVNPDTDEQIRSFALGVNPKSIAVADGVAWVVNSTDGTLLRIDIASGESRTIPLGGKPESVAVGFGSVWVADPF